MSKKVIACRPAPEVELAFDGGDTVLLRFDVYAMMCLQEMAEDGLAKLLTESSTPELCALIIYAGGQRSGLTLEKSRALVSDMDPATITEIINEFNSSVNRTSNEAQEELAKKMMAQFLNTQK